MQLSTRRFHKGLLAYVAVLAFTALTPAGCSSGDPEADAGEDNNIADTGEGDGLDLEVSGKDAGSGDTGVDVGVDTGPGDECTKATVAEDCKDKVKADVNKCEIAECKAGKCAVGKAPADTPCDDGKACTAGDKCVSGSCTGEVSCPSKDGNACEEGFCQVDNSCGFKNKEGPCDDNNLCTKDDACKFKTCNGTPIDVGAECDDKNACTNDICDPKKGCDHDTVGTAGKQCNDGDACTEGDKCEKDGKCVSGVKVVCDDANSCTNDKCDATEGCQHKAIADGADCDDASKCTTKDICTGGKCSGELIPDAKPTSLCEQVTCDPNTGKVTSKAAGNGTACDDGQPCTISDLCNDGQCKGKPLVCNKGNPCKLDFCDEKTGQCAESNVKEGTDCNDGDACTTKTICTNGACKGLSWQDSAQCDDKNGCTTDGCAPQSGCFHVPANDKFCDDGNACSEPDKCFGGKCVGTPKSCDDGNPCTKDACDEKTGQCSHESFVGPCDDGDKCTTNTICQAGECKGNKVVCDDKNSCTSGICDSKVGCQYIPKVGGAPCDDGIACSLNDKCDAGQCKGDLSQCVPCTTDLSCKVLPSDACSGQWKCHKATNDKQYCEIDPLTVVQCAATDDECSANICNPKTAKCELKIKQEGTPCLSGDKCVDDKSKTCSKQGKCEGETIDCDDNESCTVDICDKGKGCINTPKLDKTVCDDGSICTPKTECLKGVCSGPNNCECTKDADCAKYEDGDLCNGLWKCLPDGASGKNFCAEAPNSAVVCKPLSGEPCKQNLCDKGTGQCAPKPVTEGAKCDDGHACTIAETCQSGACVKGATVDCDDANPCTIDVCDKVFGCANAPVNDGGACDDGTSCTEKDKCTSGKCAGTKTNCDDENVCTVDLCDPKTGKCASILNDKAECDDGDACTKDDVCKDGKCTATALKCDDGDSCTIDACDGAGGCKNILVVGKDCTDNDQCTTGDTCGSDGKCLGKPKNCSDGNLCTVDQCVKGACVITAAIGQACDDNNACTENDKCDPQGSCVSNPVNCDDGNPCTAVVGACSPKNGCTVVASDGKSCNDGDLCTISDTCAGKACQGIKLNCDDKNPCTDDSCDPKKGCVNKGNTCDDGNDCTSATCDKNKGCIFSPIDGFQPCEDNDACTTGGVCNKDKCESKIVKCDDDNPCTKDSCDPKAVLDDQKKDGCVFLPIEDTNTVCDDGNPCTDDKCDGLGKCVGKDKICDDDNPCTTDSCDKLKGCVTEDLKEGATCDDGDVCTANTKCQAGFCSGGQVTCPICPGGTDKECAIFDDNNLCNGKFKCVLNNPKDPKQGGKCVEDKNKVVCETLNDTACRKNTCDTLTGACQMTELVNGSECDDGVPCTIKDVCNNGQCLSGIPADCSSVGDACNEATCIADLKSDKGYACVALPKTGTVICDADNDGCTAQDHCEAGKCVAGKKVDCEGIQGECEVAFCNNLGPKKFTCATKPAPNYSSCNDGQLCTAGDFCENGKCKAGLKAYDCSAQTNPCADFTCDAKGNGGTGACMPKPKNEGGGCNADDNGCTVKDICVLGQCVPGAPPDCSSENGTCTLGACKSSSSGAFSCVATPRNESKPCEADNNGCTVDDHCEAGKCVAGKMMDCSKYNGNGGCLIGSCIKISSSQGNCKALPAPLNTGCNADDNGCTKDDKCNDQGACINGPPVDCLAFSGTCSTGKCEPDPKDFNKFTCKGAPKADNTKCDADGDGCTVGDKCTGGKCVPGPAPDCSKEAQGACILGGCKNKGSDQYLCQPEPKTDGEECDADNDGCTVKDTCVGGTCAKGPLETCSDFTGLCADAVCKSESNIKFTCQQTPKESYPPLKEATLCGGANNVACPTNYKCEIVDDKTKEGQCVPKVTISCNDGDSCTENDVCAMGKCQGGAGKDCDDKDPCTLDSCTKGQCGHSAIPGCATCIDEKFQLTSADGSVPPLPKEWMLVSNEPPIDPAKPPKAPLSPTRYGMWALQKTLTYNYTLWALQSKWESKYEAVYAKVTNNVVSRLLHRRLYLRDSNAMLSFQLMMTVADQSCNADTFSVWINNQKVWERCSSVKTTEVTGGFMPVTIDLAKWVGAPMDLEFRTYASSQADATGNTGFGEVTLDHIKLTGGCGNACMGIHFEEWPAGQVDEPPPLRVRMPQTWNLENTSGTYAAWKVDPKVGHTGTSSIAVKYTGAPPGSKAQTSSFTMPQIKPVKGDSLFFALRIAELGSTTCGADDISVLIDGQAVYKRCDVQKDWKVQEVDLSAYDGKSISVTFQVTTGADAKAKGSFEIDDVAIMGKCTWACFFDNFDVDGIKKWNSVSTSTKTLNWVTTSTGPMSKPNSAYFAHDATVADDTQSNLISGLDAGGQVVIPMTGATYSYAANVFVQKDHCEAPAGTDPPKPALLVGLHWTPDALTGAPAPTKTDKDPRPFNLGAPFCKSTSGWQVFSGPVDSGTVGDPIVPVIEGRKAKGNDVTKALFDDFVITCN